MSNSGADWPVPPGGLALGRDQKTGELITVTEEMRKLGMLISGLPNMGKSSLMLACMKQDYLMCDGVVRGFMLGDPHGTLANAFINIVVTHGLHLIRPIRILDPTDNNYSFFLNPLKWRDGVDPSVFAAAFKNAVMRAIWKGKPTDQPQTSETLTCLGYVLCEFNLPLPAAIDLLSIEDTTGLRAYVANNTKNPVTRSFWLSIDKLPIPVRKETLGSTQRRLSRFLMPDRIRRVFSEPQNVINWREIMDQAEVVVLNLAYGEEVDEDEMQLLGTLILSSVFVSAQGRPVDSIPFYIYWDEVYKYLNDDVARLFTETRKFRVHPVVAHQILAQLEECGSFAAQALLSARIKAVFGGLPYNDAEYFVKDAMRGQLDFNQTKSTRPTVVGHEISWLLSEGKSAGTNHSIGTSGSVTHTQGTNTSTTVTEGESFEESYARASSDGTTEGLTLSRNQSLGRGETGTLTSGASRGTGVTRSADRGTTESSGTAASATETNGSSQNHTDSTSEGFDVFIEDDSLFGPGEERRDERHLRRAIGASDGQGTSRSLALSAGTNSARSTSSRQGISKSESAEESASEAHGRSITRTTGTGVAHQRSRTHTETETFGTSHALSRSIAETVGSSESTAVQKGFNKSAGTSRQTNEGRSQALCPVLQDLPADKYTYQEVLSLAVDAISNLWQGEAVVKIGLRPATKIDVLRVADGWARPEHIDRVRRALFAAAPYITTIAEADRRYELNRNLLYEKLLNGEGTKAKDDKDDDWG